MLCCVHRRSCRISGDASPLIRRPPACGRRDCGSITYQPRLRGGWLRAYAVAPNCIVTGPDLTAGVRVRQISTARRTTMFDEMCGLLAGKAQARVNNQQVPSKPPLPPDLERDLSQLADAITLPTTAHRTANVEHVLENCVPQVVGLLCDRLVVRATDGPDDTRAAATASLVQIGKPAAAAVAERLRHAQGPDEQITLIKILTDVGAGLPPGDRVELYDHLLIANGQAANAAARAAAAKGLAKFRRLDHKWSAAP
jgi:hypothetical protein